MTTRMVRATRNPYNNAKVGRVTWTVGTEATNVIKVTAALKTPKGQSLGQRVAVRGWLSDASNGGSILPAYNMPSGGLAIAAKGVLIPGPLPTSCLLAKGTLAIHSTPEQFKTTSIALYRVNGGQYSKAATTALTFTAAHVVTASKYGVILVQINAAGTVSTKVPSATQAYNTAALALATLPAPDTGNVPLGYIAIANNAGDWTANTDDLTAASDLTTATFVDAAENGQYSQVFTLTTDASGVVDINVTETGIKTLYVALEMPDGSINVSPAVTFA